MEALANQHPQVKLRRVDIGQWSSPVAKQYGIDRLPTLWLYEDGELYSKDKDDIAARLQQLR